MWSAVVSAVHLLCLGLGMSLLLLRARALGAPLADRADVDRVLALDNASGAVALVWMGSGLYRAFGGLEKGTAFYASSPLFWAKMTLVGAAWVLETPIMITLIRWRVALAKGEPADVRRVPLLRRLHHAELLVMVFIVFAASFMARGVGRAAIPDVARAGAPGVEAGAASGAALYAQHCVACHQADGRGLGGALAADFVGDARRLAKPDDVLLAAIERGVPGTAMVGFADRLDADGRRRVLAYVRATFARK
jgi:putative membrane protein